MSFLMSVPDVSAKVYPYLTVEEMRKHPDLIEDLPKTGWGKRFEGSAAPDVALRYLPKDGKILECGPVFGAFTRFLQTNGYEDIHAVDFVNLLHFSDPKGLTFHEIDFNRDAMPYGNGFFDGACAWGIAEHMENPFHFIREVWRVLKPGGMFLFSLPNVSHLSSRLAFLRTGVFPRWNLKSNHIAILPKGVIEKTVFRYFEVHETLYTKPGTMVSRKPKTALRKWLDRKSGSVLPRNELFGNYVVYVLKRRKEILPPQGDMS